MLLEYGVKNYFSFKEWTTISFKLDANCPKNISNGDSVTPVMCIKGANSSGKTHLMKGLAFVAAFCRSSFDALPDANIKVSPFFDSNEPTEFFLEFTANGTFYKYEVALNEEEVLFERLYRKKNIRTSLIINRVGNEIVKVSADLENIKLLKLRKNASFISIAAQYELIELNELYEFFRHFISNVGPAGLRASPISMNDAAEIYSKQPELFEHVKKFISDCDTGISNIKISTRIDASDEKVYFPVFFHNVQNTEFPVKDIHESSGTKTLFKNMALYRFALEVGGVLILDEFDINLHPHILPKLIDFFLDKTKNPFGAQFIFTTHNSEVLDNMGRYRSYFVNKVENESFGYRLDEIPGDIVRNDRSILPTYNAGKIGGVPAL